MLGWKERRKEFSGGSLLLGENTGVYYVGVLKIIPWLGVRGEKAIKTGCFCLNHQTPGPGFAVTGAAITKAACLRNRQGTHIPNTFVAVVKCMYPNSVASTCIYVGKQSSPPEWVGNAGSAEPSYLSYRLPTPSLKISAGKLPHLPSHPSGNCCLVSGRGSNQAILIKILPTNLNTIKNWWLAVPLSW